MPYAFSGAIGGAGMYIRVSPNLIRECRLTDERPHKHTYLELHYVYEGEEILFLPRDQRRIRVPAGSIAMIPREVYHCGETKGEDQVRLVCFDFSTDPSEDSRNPVFEVFDALREVTVVSDAFVADSMERFRKILAEGVSPLRETRMGALLLDVVLELFGQLPAGDGSFQRQSRTKRRQRWLIEEHIGTQYHAPGGLVALSKKLHLSERQTRKLVKNFYGEDYKTLIVRQRMDMAQLYLESRSLSLTEVAEEIGYRSYSGFHLAFIRTFGMTPGEYREQHGYTEEK